MLPVRSFGWSLYVALGFAGLSAAAEPELELTDEKLPLHEIRPLDRRVYLLTLEGKWHQPARPGVPYYVNVLFPNGNHSHRAVDDPVHGPGAGRMLLQDTQGRHYLVETPSPFRSGEVRVVLPDHLLARYGLKQGGTLTVVVSAGKPVDSARAPAVVSNALTLRWPMDREVVREAVRTRHSAPEPADPFAPAPPKPAVPAERPPENPD